MHVYIVLMVKVSGQNVRTSLKILCGPCPPVAMPTYVLQYTDLYHGPL